jgi:hypothetical protein
MISRAGKYEQQPLPVSAETRRFVFDAADYSPLDNRAFEEHLSSSQFHGPQRLLSQGCTHPQNVG